MKIRIKVLPYGDKPWTRVFAISLIHNLLYIVYLYGFCFDQRKLRYMSSETWMIRKDQVRGMFLKFECRDTIHWCIIIKFVVCARR